jgi:hypothetical protein
MENYDTQFLQCLRWRKHLACLIEFMNINNNKKSQASKEADVAHVKNNPATEGTKKKGDVNAPYILNLRSRCEQLSSCSSHFGSGKRPPTHHYISKKTTGSL